MFDPTNMLEWIVYHLFSLIKKFNVEGSPFPDQSIFFDTSLCGVVLINIQPMIIHSWSHFSISIN